MCGIQLQLFSFFCLTLRLKTGCWKTCSLKCKLDRWFPVSVTGRCLFFLPQVLANCLPITGPSWLGCILPSGDGEKLWCCLINFHMVTLFPSPLSDTGQAKFDFCQRRQWFKPALKCSLMEYFWIFWRCSVVSACELTTECVFTGSWHLVQQSVLC